MPIPSSPSPSTTSCSAPPPTAPSTAATAPSAPTSARTTAPLSPKSSGEPKSPPLPDFPHNPLIINNPNRENPLPPRYALPNPIHPVASAPSRNPTSDVTIRPSAHRSTHPLRGENHGPTPGNGSLLPTLGRRRKPAGDDTGDPPRASARAGTPRHQKAERPSHAGPSAGPFQHHRANPSPAAPGRP